MDKLPAVILLKQFSDYKASHIGTKAMGLAELLNQKIPIPKAFVIPAFTLTQILRSNGTGPKIAHTLQNTDWTDHNSVKSSSQVIQNLIKKQKITQEFTLPIIKTYHTLIGTHAYIAVRPSYPDKNHLSKHNAILNAQGDINILDSILELWSQEFTPSQLPQRYKELKTKKLQPPSILIQEMINANAGVAFSKDPSSHNKKTIVIHSVWGVGDHIEELGQFDQFFVDTRTENIILRNIAIKKNQHIRKLDGVKTTPVSTKKRGQSSLSDDQIQSLFKIIVQLKRKHLNHLQIEWASDHNGMYVLSVETMNPSLATPNINKTQPTLSKSAARTTSQLLTQIFQETSTPHQLETIKANLCSPYFCPSNLDQLKQLKIFTKKNSAFPNIALKLIDHNQGVVQLISDHSLLKKQVEIIHQILRNTTSHLKLIIPQVKSAHELGLIKHLLQQQELATHPQLNLYMEITTPENIYHLRNYLSQKIDSFLINTQVLESHLIGREIGQGKLYSFDTQIVKTFLLKLHQFLPERSPLLHSRILLSLPEPNLSLIKIAVANYWDIVVKPSQIAKTQQVIAHTEKELF